MSDVLATLIVELVTNSDAYKKNINEARDTTQAFAKATKSNVDQARLSWTEFNSALQVAKQAISAVKQVVDQTVGSYVKYADQVENLHRLSGMSYEDSSRLIQASDDLFVSQQTLESGMEFAIRQGYKPSVEWLGKIADQIMAIPDPADRAKKAIEVFGRQAGPEMMKLLEQGRDGINQYVDAVDNAMVVTKENEQQVREYKQAVDELNDTTQIFLNTGGKGMINFLTVAGKLATTTLEDIQALADGTWSLDKVGDILAKHLESFAAARNPIDSATRSYMGWAQAIQEGRVSMGASVPVIDMFTGSILSSATALQQQQAEFGFVVSFAKQYETNIGDIAKAEDELQQAEEDLIEVRRHWSEGSQAVMDAKQKVEDLRGKLDEAKQTAEDAANEMIAGFLQVQLTLDGTFTEDDITKVLDFRLAMGLLTQEAYDAALNALSIATNLAGIPEEVSSNITITTTHQDIYLTNAGNAPTGHGGQYGQIPYIPQAEGGDWLITKPTLFLAGDAGAERATFTPQGAGVGAGARSGEGDIIVYINGPIVGSGGLDELERRLRTIRDGEDRRRAT